jgi:hypothetical protein
VAHGARSAARRGASARCCAKGSWDLGLSAAPGGSMRPVRASPHFEGRCLGPAQGFPDLAPKRRKSVARSLVRLSADLKEPCLKAVKAPFPARPRARVNKSWRGSDWIARCPMKMPSVRPLGRQWGSSR